MGVKQHSLYSEELPSIAWPVGDGSSQWCLALLRASPSQAVTALPFHSAPTHSLCFSPCSVSARGAELALSALRADRLKRAGGSLQPPAAKKARPSGELPSYAPRLRHTPSTPYAPLR